MNVKEASRLLVRASDLLCFLAVIFTGEVSLVYFAALGLLAALAYWLRRDGGVPAEQPLIPDRLQFTSILLVILGGLILVWLDEAFPVVIAVHAVATVHALNWFGVVSARNRSWRLAIGFVLLLGASILTPDFYLAGVFLAFVVIASLSLTVGFLEREFLRRSPSSLATRLPRSLFGYSVAVSFSVFFISALIFPLLPRLQSSWNIGIQGGSSGSEVGYQDSVDLRSTVSWINTKGRTPVIRIAIDETVTRATLFSRYLPKGLIRTRVLEKFEAGQWSTLPVDMKEITRSSDTPTDPLHIEFIREPFGVASLPVPYGTRAIELRGPVIRSGGLKIRSGEWWLVGSESIPIRYRAWIGGNQKDQDSPRKEHLQFPSDWKNNRWNELLAKIAPPGSSDVEAVTRMMAFYRAEKFEGVMELTAESPAPHKDQKTGAKQTLDTFLFETRQGHCELFASGAALLLRMAGVPTRLVTGFRPIRDPISGVLTIRQGDAHAWLEAYVKGQGWIPLDPTPIQVATGGRASTWAWAFGLQDQLEAYWYRYIVSFDPYEEDNAETAETAQSKKSFWERLSDRFKALWGAGKTDAPTLASYFFMAIALLILSLLAAGWMKRPTVSKKTKQLRQRQRKFDRWQKSQNQKHHDATRDSLASEWNSIYEQLRFGKIEIHSPQWPKAIERLDHLLAQLRQLASKSHLKKPGANTL